MDSSKRLSFTSLIAGLGLLVTSCASDGAPQQVDEDISAAPMAVTAGGEGIFDLPFVQRDLPNGLRVIIVPTDYPDIVTMQVPMQVGSRHETEAGVTGFAHFFEHMMGRGTEQYPYETYEEIMRNAGAGRNASTSDDWTNYYVTFTNSDLETILEVQADRFQNLTYTEEMFRTEALAVKGEYLKNYANPIRRAFESIRGMAFNTHTYSHTTMGFFEDIEAMPDQIEYSQEFFDRFYRPERATMILVGDLDPEATFELVARYWGSWERGDFVDDIPVEPEPTGPIYAHEQMDVPTQPWVFYTFRGPAFDPSMQDMPAMDLVQELYFSQNSELYQQLVIEQQLADQYFTHFPNQADPGLLYIAARLTDPANAGAVRDLIFETVVRSRTELADAAELDRIKSRLKYRFASGLSSSESIGTLLRAFAHYDRDPVGAMNGVYATYDSLTPEDVRHYANRYLVDAGLVSLSLSNDAEMAGAEVARSLDEAVAMRGESMAPAAAMMDGRIAFEPGPHAGQRPRVYARQTSSPLVDVMFQFQTGSAHDPAGQAGLATLTAMMVANAGSAALTTQEVTERMFPLAAGFGAQVGVERVTFGGQVHRDNLDAWYEVVRGQLLTPGFREEDFQRLRTQLVNNIRASLRGNNDEELGKEALYEFIYGEYHPYGHLRMGHVADIESLTLDDIREFYATHFTVGALTVAISGGYSDDFRSRITGDMGYLPAGDAVPMEIPDPPTFAGRYARLIQKDTSGVAVSFGFPIDVNRSDADWVALLVAQSWLGQHRSSNSWLYQRIRRIRGMNYGDYAYIEYFPNGMFQMMPSAGYPRSQQIFQVWLRPLRSNNDAMFATRTALFELERLISEGMSEADFELTRNYLSKFVALMTADQTSQLGYDLDSYFYGIPNFTQYVRRGLDRLTLDDVNAALREHLGAGMGNIKFVMISPDAESLHDAIEQNWPSPMQYNSVKEEDLLAEDEVIMGIDLETVGIEIVPVDEVFEASTADQR
jgi:zinc protease